VDGGQHATHEGERHDALRDLVLRREGSRILRFWNAEVDRNFDGVMRVLFLALSGADPRPSRFAAHPPHKGEES